ncbi:MAG: FHA domain-containing protein [Actinobacteria bacterium]|nr:FHA domain-containing protein [Actinomycetota bacterium]
MSDQLLFVLRLALLALLYLFFFRVLRAVWAEIKPPVGARPVAPAAPRQAKRAKAKPPKRSELLVLDPPDQRGHTYPLGDELTLGRAAGCHVTVDDTFVSQIHARVFARDGQYLVEDLGSTNGTYLNRKKVSGPMMMQRGDRLQVGNTVLELQ